jgi:dienelactone hydrolase
MSRRFALFVLVAATLAFACTPTGSPAEGPAAPGAFAEGCDGATRRRLPEDPAQRGPYDVGARTIELPRLRAEVWYPAAPGAAEGRALRIYDLREALAPSEAEKVSDAQNPWQPCDCVEGIEPDREGGPFPVVVFVHGTASFRTQSLGLATVLASRGFVVVAADHPGLSLHDTLAPFCGYPSTGSQALVNDISLLLATLSADDEGPLAFLSGRLAADRVALVGHSAGGNAVAQAAGLPGVRAVASLAGAVPIEVAAVRGLFLAAREDSIVAPSRTRSAFDASVGPRAFATIEGAGHLAFSDLCATQNADGENLLEVGVGVGLCGAQLAGFLFDCDPGHRAPEEVNPPFHAAVVAALSGPLQCAEIDVGEALAAYPIVADLLEVEE